MKIESFQDEYTRSHKNGIMDKISDAIEKLKEAKAVLRKCIISPEIASAIDHVSAQTSLLEELINHQKAVIASRLRCETCGITDPKYFNRKISECVPCMSKVVYAKSIHKLEKGKARNVAARVSRGECVDCKIKVTETNALSFDWDHRDPTEKSFAISRMNTRSDELFFAEIAKCDLICRNCHMLKTKRQFDSGLLKKKPNMKEKAASGDT